MYSIDFKSDRRLQLVSAFVGLMAVFAASDAPGQTTSLTRRNVSRLPAERKSPANPRHPNARRGNPTLEKHSLTAVEVAPPRTFAVHDLITIVIREQVRFEADGELDSQKKFDVKSELNAFFKPINGGLGAATFMRGMPNVDYKFDSKVKNGAEKERKDRLTTRITAEVLDVKPNGNLVLQARGTVTFENEEQGVVLTGTVRSRDVTPDNTVLSTQLADKNIVIDNRGAVRDGSRRGWVTRLLDLLRPI